MGMGEILDEMPARLHEAEVQVGERTGQVIACRPRWVTLLGKRRNGQSHWRGGKYTQPLVSQVPVPVSVSPGGSRS